MVLHFPNCLNPGCGDAEQLLSATLPETLSVACIHDLTRDFVRGRHPWPPMTEQGAHNAGSGQLGSCKSPTAVSSKLPRVYWVHDEHERRIAGCYLLLLPVYLVNVLDQITFGIADISIAFFATLQPPLLPFIFSHTMRDGKKTVLVLNGPNLNLLGTREPHLYGHETLSDVEAAGLKQGKELGINVEFFQRYC